jgi:predicted transcriptional regulator
MANKRGKRSRSDLICDILSEAVSGANKTRLMYRCNMSFVRFNHYLRDMLDAGLIECVGANPGITVLYKTTDKGFELLQVLRRASDLMSI